MKPVKRGIFRYKLPRQLIFPMCQTISKILTRDVLKILGVNALAVCLAETVTLRKKETRFGSLEDRKTAVRTPATVFIPSNSNFYSCLYAGNAFY